MRQKRPARDRALVRLDCEKHADVLALIKQYPPKQRPMIAAYLAREGMWEGIEPVDGYALAMPSSADTETLTLRFTADHFPALQMAYKALPIYVRREAMAYYVIRGARHVLQKGGVISSERLHQAMALGLGHQPAATAAPTPQAPARDQSPSHTISPQPAPSKGQGMRNMLASLAELGDE